MTNDRYIIRVKHLDELVPMIAGLVKEGICFECEMGGDNEGWIIRCTGGF